ncbi:DUF805 domain-containing protein [Staphylococcus chromogenes]|uniref:DUF805 domain-containing protein n=1 Tax=Staphylococcus chromogenes TaxID=46126 RepID=UPI000D1BF8A2|nr:DUF805 domain-containing protein [Staphylococcus chromogenes]PTG05772.1 DUF805 domain-containing protein [Staphylococcus chromogenes]
MNQPQSILTCYQLFWTRLFDFKGRSTRKEFWHPLWMNAVIMVLLSFIISERASYIFSFLIFIPNLTVMTRRLHDVNRSMFLAIVFNLSSYISLVLFFLLLLVPTGVVTHPFGESLLVITVFTGGIALVFLLFYTLFALVMKGNSEPNHYGDGGTAALTQTLKTIET